MFHFTWHFLASIWTIFRAREQAVNSPVGVESVRNPYRKSGPFSRPVLSNNIITLIQDDKLVHFIGPLYWSGPPGIMRLLRFYGGKGGM